MKPATGSGPTTPRDYVPPNSHHDRANEIYNMRCEA